MGTHSRRWVVIFTLAATCIATDAGAAEAVESRFDDPGNTSVVNTEGLYAKRCTSECDDYTDCFDSALRTSFSVDALFLQLDHGTRDAVPVVLNQDTSEAVLSTDDLAFDMVAGVRLNMKVPMSNRTAIEALYFGQQDWQAAVESVGNNNLGIPGDLALATLDFFDADRMRLSYSAEIHNAEVNYICRLGQSRLFLLGGFRYVSLDESFGINSFDIDSGTSDYSIQAANNLYGGQLGGKWHAERDMYELNVVGKAGVYGNDASQSTFVADFDNSFILRNSRTNASHVAFVGDLAINGAIRITEHINGVAGYNLIWIEGVSRAAAQLDFTDTPNSGTALLFDTGAFMHGVSVGLEINW